MAKSFTDIAIFGGTFDPIHNGHIACAEHIVNWLENSSLKLNELRLMPSHIPPHKSGTHATSNQRLEMVNFAIKSSQKLSVDARELLSDTPSYTSETLADIHQQLPNSRLFFVIGFDSLLSFTRWHKWQKILSLAHIIVCTRPGYRLANANEQTHELLADHQVQSITELTAAKAGGIIFAPEITQDIASSTIRQQFANDEISNAAKQIPTQVFQYIQQQQLYQTSK